MGYKNLGSCDFLQRAFLRSSTEFISCWEAMALNCFFSQEAPGISHPCSCWALTDAPAPTTVQIRGDLETPLSGRCCEAEWRQILHNHSSDFFLSLNSRNELQRVPPWGSTAPEKDRGRGCRNISSAAADPEMAKVSWCSTGSPREGRERQDSLQSTFWSPSVIKGSFLLLPDELMKVTEVHGFPLQCPHQSLQPHGNVPWEAGSELLLFLPPKTSSKSWQVRAYWIS